MITPIYGQEVKEMDLHDPHFLPGWIWQKAYYSDGTKKIDPSDSNIVQLIFMSNKILYIYL